MLKNAVFCDVTSCGSCKNRCFGATYRFHHKVENNQRVRIKLAIQTAFAVNVPSSLILFTLLREVIDTEPTFPF
jgi:hypothetical protein